MTPERNESTIEDPKKPWVWGDETEAQQEEKPTEDSGRSYTSVAELLAAEDAAEIKRLEDFFKTYKTNDGN